MGQPVGCPTVRASLNGPRFLGIDLMAAETIVPWCGDAVAIPNGQREALRDGDRQIGADAGEAAAGQVMPRRRVHFRCVRCSVSAGRSGRP
jgi:hypothetical protein